MGCSARMGSLQGRNIMNKAQKLHRQYLLRSKGINKGFIALSPESVKRYLAEGWYLSKNTVNGTLIIKK